MKKMRELTNWIWLDKKTAAVKEQDSQAKQLWLIDEFDGPISERLAAIPNCVNFSNMLSWVMPELPNALPPLAKELAEVFHA